MAMCCDNILAIVLKTCALELAAHLARLLQYSYNTGINPTIWKIAQKCHEHTKLNKFNPVKYCPVSLILIISEVMKSVINSAIEQHLLSNNTLSETQFGFCQGHSAPDLITALVQIWTKELNSK
eukprot:g29274.t1